MTDRNIPGFDAEIHHDGAPGPVVIAVSGDFDLTKVDAFEQAVGKAPGGRDLVVDLEHASLLDSAAIGAILRLVRDRRVDGRECRVQTSRPFQRRLFEITGLAHLLAE